MIKSNEIIVEDVSETNDYMSLSENETIKLTQSILMII